jgi:cystathionine beta-lyase/cystathionine gamma-synthase
MARKRGRASTGARSATRKPRQTAAPRQQLATRAAHAGAGHHDEPFGQLGPAGERSHNVPLYQTSNFVYPDGRAADEAAAGRAFLYSRQGNPTTAAFERALADLEGGEAGLSFASGMAAMAAATLALGTGGEVLVSDAIYGGSTELVRDLGPRHGLEPRFVPGWDTDAVAAALTPRTRLILVETMTNPLLRVADVRALGALAHRRGIALLVDATFTPPVLCRPLDLGATIVVHSVSKYIGGHGDLIGGVAVGGEAAIAKLRRYRTLLGGIMDPFCAWLALRGTRTLAVRVERQCATAARLAARLDRAPGVRAVHYPGLRHHPDHARAGRLMRAPGAMISFELRDGKAARRFYDRVQLIARAASLGEVTSLLTHPASFSHKGLPPAERERLGIREGLLRLSVGLEDPADLEADLQQALGR